jgi:hypothetical protein
MTKPDWPSIKADYVETQMTLADVETKWGVPGGTLRARAARERWRDERQQFATKLAQARQEKLIDKAAESQALFPSVMTVVARIQLAKISTLLREPDLDAGKLQKLTAALANVQKIYKGTQT